MKLFGRKQKVPDPELAQLDAVKARIEGIRERAADQSPDDRRNVWSIESDDWQSAGGSPHNHSAVGDPDS